MQSRIMTSIFQSPSFRRAVAFFTYYKTYNGFSWAFGEPCFYRVCAGRDHGWLIGISFKGHSAMGSIYLFVFFRAMREEATPTSQHKVESRCFGSCSKKL